MREWVTEGAESGHCGCPWDERPLGGPGGWGCRRLDGRRADAAERPLSAAERPLSAAECPLSAPVAAWPRVLPAARMPLLERPAPLLSLFTPLLSFFACRPANLRSHLSYPRLPGVRAWEPAPWCAGLHAPVVARCPMHHAAPHRRLGVLGL